MGKPENIEEAKAAVKEIIETKPHYKENIDINSDLSRFLFDRIQEINEIGK